MTLIGQKEEIKIIVVVCDRLSKHQTHRRVLLFKMHNDEIYMLLIKFLARLGAQEVALSVCPCVCVCVSVCDFMNSSLNSHVSGSEL